LQESCIQPWPHYDADEIEVVSEVLRSGQVNYWTGQQGRQFEREFADYCGTRYAVAVTNGTFALECALRAAGVGPGDEVVVTPRSFFASASCAVFLGATPVFADVDPDSENITVQSVERVLTPATKAVIAVHHAGWPCEMDEIMELADERELLVVEDCAQAHGATYKNRPVGSLGHVAAFSFCQDKIMSTGGEGGMLVTNSEELWRRVWSYKDHGKNFDSVFHKDHPVGFRWLHDSFGTNGRMTEMQSAIGRLQLGKLHDWSSRRRQNAALLRKSLSKFKAVRVPEVPPWIKHAYYRLYVHINTTELNPGWDRDKVVSELNAAGVPTFTGSCPEIYREKAIQSIGFQPEERLPIARALGQSSVAFLVHPTLSDENLSFVTNKLESIFGEASRS